MDDDDLLEIPDFLKRKYDPSKKFKEYKIEKRRWIMPDMQSYKHEREEREKRKHEIIIEKQERKQRKSNKIKIEGYVIEAMSKGHNTFGQIKNNIPSDIEDKDIKTAITRLINKNKVIKVTRRIYKLK